MAQTAVKLASVIALVPAVSIAWQKHTYDALREELTSLEQQPRPIAPKAPIVRDNSALRTEAAALNERVTAAGRAQTDAQTKLAETQETVRLLEEEVVISHGKIEDLARSMMKTMMPIIEAMSALKKVSGTEREAKEAELMAQTGPQLIELIPLQKVVFKLEDRPADAARFFATALDEPVKLPADLHQRIEGALQADFEQLKNDGLSFSQLPKDNAEAWIARRMAVSEQIEAHLMALLPQEFHNHSLFQTEGFLGGLFIGELSHLGGEAKAAPLPPATKP